MRTRYKNWIESWEYRLTTRDSNRVVRPFEWGLDWARHWPLVNGNFPTGDGGAERFFRDLEKQGGWEIVQKEPPAPAGKKGAKKK